MKAGIDYTGITTVFFCHDGNGNYLMHKRSSNARDEQGRWDCGAGKLEHGMSIEDSLRKEIKEEFGCDVLEIEFLGYRDVHRKLEDGTKTHWLALDYRCLVDSSQVVNNEPHKFDDISWVDVHNPPQPMHSQWPIAYEACKDRL